MANFKPRLEVVRVVGMHWLVDSRSRLRTYRRRERETLEPAYYVVSPPTALPAQGYDEDAEFTGPFESPSQAHAVLDRMVRQRSEREAEPAALLRPKQEHD